MSLAGCRPGQVDYLNCHGTATLLNDALETQAIKKAFGAAAGDVSCSSTKASTGHMLAATGAVEAVFAILASRDGRIPPTLNLEDPDPACDLDFTPLKSCSRPVRNAMSLSFGFGGAIGALVFSRC
jgi:3-oxoacyl-[acyl-carrier-protein] synthase II